MNSGPSRSITVTFDQRSYCVDIGCGIAGPIGPRLRGLWPDSKRAFAVVDAALPARFVEAFITSLQNAAFTITTESVVATERTKSLATIGRLLSSLARAKHERNDPVLALGGGVIGDLAGFAAATYRRGVPIVQCPTTLLAMVDASVGGKTGVNLDVDGALLKNMAGAFWQPRLVIADIASLRSLPDRHFRCGLAECLKHGLMAGDIDAELWCWTIANLPRIHCRDENILTELVARNVAVKARIVEGDEREEAGGAGGRALLNLGHTFAHAIETIPHLTPDGDPEKAPLLHGEAVGLGLIAAAATAQARGLIGDDLRQEIRDAVAQAGLPTVICSLPADDALLASMAHDKKVAGGRLRLVLPMARGRAAVFDETPQSDISRGFDAIRA